MLLSTLLPWFSPCGKPKILSEYEREYMIEQAKQGNTTAMNELLVHHAYSGNIGMPIFYQYQKYLAGNNLSENEYKQLSEYAEAGNETAKEKLKEYQWFLYEQQNLYDYFDNNITRIQQFIQICSEDDICKSSDIYEYYTQQAKDISGNKTE
jgi:hypothetical protein